MIYRGLVEGYDSNILSFSTIDEIEKGIEVRDKERARIQHELHTPRTTRRIPQIQRRTEAMRQGT